MFCRRQRIDCVISISVKQITETFGPTVPYRNNPELQRLVRRFSALPFLPVIAIRPALTKLVHEASTHPTHSSRLTQYVDYFERQWMANPLVPKRMWNIPNANRRTNNDSKSFNAWWNRKVGKTSPSFYEFVSHLRSTQSDTKNAHAQIAAGIPSPPRKPKYVQMDACINGYLARWQNPTAQDILNNDVTTTNRLLVIFANMIKHNSSIPHL